MCRVVERSGQVNCGGGPERSPLDLQAATSDARSRLRFSALGDDEPDGPVLLIFPKTASFFNAAIEWCRKMCTVEDVEATSFGNSSYAMGWG